MASATLRSVRRRAAIAAVVFVALAVVTPWRAAHALQVGVVQAIPPFVFRDAEKGILIEIVDEAASRMGVEADFRQMPSRQFDFDPLADFPELDMFVGTPRDRREGYHYLEVFQFDNVAVSRREDALEIESVEDLAGKTIVAFNGASVHLKEPFTTFHRERLAEDPKYREVEDQYGQAQMLRTGRAEVILLDRYMVSHHLRTAARASGAQVGEYVFHEIFPEKNGIFAVSDDLTLIEGMQDALEAMRADGWFDELIGRWSLR